MHIKEILMKFYAFTINHHPCAMSLLNSITTINVEIMLHKLREYIRFKILRPLRLKLGDWMGKYSAAGDRTVSIINNSTDN